MKIEVELTAADQELIHALSAFPDELKGERLKLLAFKGAILSGGATSAVTAMPVLGGEVEESLPEEPEQAEGVPAISFNDSDFDEV